MLDLNSDVFVFATEVKGPGTRSSVRLLKIVYEYTDADGPLPKTFFDYARTYELKVHREAYCDETLASLSKFEVSGKDTVGQHINKLTVLTGVPAEALKTNEKEKLPCFVLWPKSYVDVKARETKGQTG